MGIDDDIAVLEQVPMLRALGPGALRLIALGLTNLPYAIQSMWGDGGNDVWLIDATSGKRTRIAEKLEFQAQLSPGAKYVVWFDQGKWWSYATATGERWRENGNAIGV